MATLGPSLAHPGFDAFRASLPPGSGDALTANRLCALGYPDHLAKGAQLVPDPRHDRLVYMVSGCAKLIVATGAALPASQVLAFHFAGDLISVLRQDPHESWGDFRLQALTDCEVLTFPADEFLDIAQGEPAVLRSVLTRSLQALHRSRTRMMQMGHKSARQRIADFLVSMAERLAGACQGPCSFSLPMSRRDIGDSLGLTIETVSRQLTELRDAGLVETEGRSKVSIADVAALAAIAGRMPGTSQRPVGATPEN